MHKRKRPLTLLEIMIVIFLIGLIGSVIGYNMKGSLDEGKAFKTREGASQIRDILLLEVAKGQPIDDVVGNIEYYLGRSGLVKNVQKLVKDGWGVPYEIRKKKNSDIVVHSKKLEAYQRAKNKNAGSQIVEDEEEAEGEDWDEN